MDIIVTSTPHVPGYKIKEVKGLLMGLAPRTRGLGVRSLQVWRVLLVEKALHILLRC